MRQIDFCYPNGCTGALTLSYDDGTIYDRRLVEILNAHGLKGTFNLNSGKLGLSSSQSGWKGYIDGSEVAPLYAGHEVAAHTVSHPWLTTCSDAVIRAELMEDRAALEALVNYPVTGFVLPFGDGRNDPRVMRLLHEAGFVYSRHTASTGNFEVPSIFLDWGVTCHHNHAELQTLWGQFLGHRKPRKLFYLWGHSYEFEDRQNWAVIEQFAALAASATEIWKATNGQIYAYLAAYNALVWGTNLELVYNPSAISVWVKVKGKPTEIQPGATLRL